MSQTAAQDAMPTLPSVNGETHGKFVLFAVPTAERVEDGPVMRGLLETDEGKVNVAAWRRFARDTGNEYLSLKVGVAKPRSEAAGHGGQDEWLVGPYYGRLFREVSFTHSGAKRVRYFGFIENAARVGEDAETGRGIYRTQWQVHVRARPNVSKDGKTHYIDGIAAPAGARVPVEGDELPF